MDVGLQDCTCGNDQRWAWARVRMGISVVVLGLIRMADE